MNKKLLAIVLTLVLTLACMSAFAAEGDRTEFREETTISYIHTSAAEGSYKISLPGDFALQYSSSKKAAVGEFKVGVEDIVYPKDENAESKDRTMTISTIPSLTLINGDYQLHCNYYQNADHTTTFPNSTFFTWSLYTGDTAKNLVDVYLMAPVSDDTAVGDYEGTIVFSVNYTNNNSNT